MSDEQILKITLYTELLLKENEKYNLTGYRSVDQIVSNLFADSLCSSEFVNYSKLNSICDVGTGSGFPGLALKIAFPHLKVFLIEVRRKRINFLEKVIEQLKLRGVEIIELDWRTFNRKTALDIELFVTKAAFGEEEICRMYRQNCNYKDKCLVYWTSAKWTQKPCVEHHVGPIFDYENGNRNLRLVTFVPENKKINYENGVLRPAQETVTACKETVCAV